mmetsp:Transcript_17404/g.19829  ORF Transcript_17404/g.19829 Transcript_17404/m.19829 type:complete len:361 (+) Transcript_17404:33-1115(+)
MSKDFGEFARNPENYSRYKPKPPSARDPNLYTNGPVYEEILQKTKFVESYKFCGLIGLSLITAPLTTIHTSLQLSVMPHRNLYGDVSGVEANKLANIPKEITVQDRRRYELLIKSGVTGTNKPFRAPVYTGYFEVIQALMRQGFLGFYKGNLIGMTHLGLTGLSRMYPMHHFKYSNSEFYHGQSNMYRICLAIMMATGADMLLNPLYMMQSRFILQNRLTNFSTYKGIMHFFKKHMKNPMKLYLGYTVHLPKNVLTIVGPMLVSKDASKTMLIASTQLNGILTYPLITIARRLHCQDPAPGMLPLRYSGVSHALKLIIKEEGIKGIYRGYLCYALANLIMMVGITEFSALGERMYDLQYN